jgi:hypothetical protein
VRDDDDELCEQTARGVLALELERANEAYVQAERDYRNTNSDPWGQLTVSLERAAQRYTTLAYLIETIDDIHDDLRVDGRDDDDERDADGIMEANDD